MTPSARAALFALGAASGFPDPFALLPRPRPPRPPQSPGIPAATIRRIARAMHQRTGATVEECGRWLEEAHNDVERAVEMMRVRVR